MILYLLLQLLLYFDFLQVVQTYFVKISVLDDLHLINLLNQVEPLILVLFVYSFWLGIVIFELVVEMWFKRCSFAPFPVVLSVIDWQFLSLLDLSSGNVVDSPNVIEGNIQYFYVVRGIVIHKTKQITFFFTVHRYILPQFYEVGLVRPRVVCVFRFQFYYSCIFSHYCPLTYHCFRKYSVPNTFSQILPVQNIVHLNWILQYLLILLQKIIVKRFRI